MAKDSNPENGKVKKGFFHNWIVKNILWAIVFVAVLIVAAVLLLRAFTRHNEELIVPDMTNMSVREARIEAANHGMKVEIADSVYVRRMARGAVYKHDPKAGAHVKKGRRILLTINAVTPKSVTMPNLVGYSMRQAKAELLSRGLQLGKLIYVNDMATNNVLSQVHNNSEIRPGTVVESETVIDLIVGLNESDNTTYVPYVVGSRFMNAVDAVHDNSLNIEDLFFDETVKDYSDSLNAMVYVQNPYEEDEPLRMGSGVTLYLTTDKNKVPAHPEPEITIE
ncbi:MAG: PASTA domain-containing protein [Bacteroidales bacterium]|nr:PASTA domain-containing protein [Bacteroidales bacterium]